MKELVKIPLFHRWLTVLVAAVLLWSLNSCKNPLDMDDDKSHRSVDNPKAVVLTRDSIELQSVEGTDTPEALSKTFRFADDGPSLDTASAFCCTVDTSSAVPKLSLCADLVPTGQYTDPHSYSVQRLCIRVKNLAIDGENIVSLDSGQLTAVVWGARKRYGRPVDVLDTVQLKTFDEYDFAYLAQNVVSGRRALRLSLDFQVKALSQIEGKLRGGRLRAVAKFRY